jgi:hypothetical protein
MKLFPLALCLLLFATYAHAATAVSLNDENPATLWAVENGSIEKDAATGVLRWHINDGQTSRLAIDPENPLFARLYDYDLLQGEWRVASGEINEIGLYTLGRITGPRRGRVHQWTLGINTTSREAWHEAMLDLARPSWLPWNNPDGEGTDAYFRFECMALAPNTVIEFRNLRLKHALVRLKPDWEAPITWPLKTENEDGSVTYHLTYEVLNDANRRADIEARVLSINAKFKVAFETPKFENVAHGGRVTFKLAATISREDIVATPELYAEPLRVAFGLADAPDAAWPWSGVLVRPLRKGLKHQLIVAPADLELLRTHLQAGDAAAKKLTGFDRTVKQADEFVNVRLDHIPGGYSSPATRFPVVKDEPGKGRLWQIGSFMPEIVEKQSGRREVATPTADALWKFYLANGGATENLGDAFLLTGDEKYARKAVELLALYGRQYTEFPLRDTLGDVPWSAGPNLLSSSRTSTSSTYGGNWNFKWIFKMLAAIGESQAWKDADKTAIYNGFILPYATESMKFPGGISNMSDIASHNQLIAGLIFDDANLAYWATMRDSGLLKRLNDIDDDGFSSEGRPVSYHLAAMDEYLPAIVYLGNSGLELPGLDKNKILKAFRMPYERATLAGRVPTTGDMARGFSLRKSKLADYLIGLFPQETWLLDAGTGSTLASQARRLAAPPATSASTSLLSTQPKLYRNAGFAILRSGATPETQIMVTLDWGRSVMHSGFDRNQITLSAFGKTYSQGPGSLYNVGSGGITRNLNPQLEAFINYSTLSHNLVTVDGKDQLRAVGKLLKWSDDPARQIAVARVDGIAPGVSHTRGVLLAQGVVVVLDRLESKDEHTYDWTYHDFGVLSVGAGWTSRAVEKPLGASSVYQNIVEPKQLQNSAPDAVLQARWDLSEQVNPFRKETASPAFLNFWHGGASGEYYSGATGLNNPNTMMMPDAAPSIFHRARGKAADFWTVLEPTKGTSRIKSVAPGRKSGVSIVFTDGTRADYNMDDLLSR